jgi:hypothetical protein
MPPFRPNILLWMVVMAALPSALASCDPNFGVNKLYCSRGFADGKHLASLPSVQEFSGCAKLLLSECTTFEGMGFNCNNPACDAEYGDGDLDKLPLFLYPGRRATKCNHGCALYMPRAQLCTVCLQKAHAALDNVTDIIWVISAVIVQKRNTILQSANPRGRRLVQASWNPEWNKAVVRRSGWGQPIRHSPGTSMASSRAQQSTSGAAPTTVRKLGEVTLAMDKMDATDAVVRTSITSPVPQGNTFAKFGAVLDGVVINEPPSAPGVAHVDTIANNFIPNSPLYVPVTPPANPFPVGKLRYCTERLLQRDKDVGCCSLSVAMLNCLCTTVPSHLRYGAHSHFSAQHST